MPRGSKSKSKQERLDGVQKLLDVELSMPRESKSNSKQKRLDGAQTSLEVELSAYECE
jgi:hypothetical protein